MNSVSYLLTILLLVSSFCNCQHDPTSELSEKHKSATATTTIVKPEPWPILSGNITGDNNKICLRYHFSIMLNMAYKQNNKVINKQMWIPSNAKVMSNNCSDQRAEAFWFQFGNQSIFNLTFEQNGASVYLASINSSIKLSDVQKPIEIAIKTPNPNFSVDKNHSYVCANNVTFRTKDGQSEIIFSNLKLQAFMESQNGTFSDEHNCQNEINDVVPIAVGAALGSLVIILMIAYFIGRRRSRRMAYQSV